MSDSSTRSVTLTRISRGHYVATNSRGGTLVFSSAGDESFSPVELLLTAIAGCTAIDVDYIVSKRSEPVHYEVAMSATRVSDSDGSHLVDLAVRFDVQFPDDDGGKAARDILPSAVARSHDRLCTVSRTVELGTPVAVSIA